MIEYLINKLFSIIMKVSEKFSYTLKKIREKEIKLYHFIKIKFSLICFRLIRNKKYVCFSGAGVIIESHQLKAAAGLLVVSLFGFIPSGGVSAYTYQEVLDYAASAQCNNYMLNACDCIDPARRVVTSAYYDMCYPYLSHGCKIYNRIDGGYDVYQTITRFNSNWYSDSKAIDIACTASNCASTNCGGTILCDGNINNRISVPLGTPICDNFAVSCAVYYKRCDGLYHGGGSGPCNYCPGTLNPLRTVPFTSMGSTPKVYDSGGCFAHHCMVSSVGYTCDPYVLKCQQMRIFPGAPSFDPDWGTGTQTDTKQRGAHRKYLGTQKKGIGGYEKPAE